MASKSSIKGHDMVILTKIQVNNYIQLNLNCISFGNFSTDVVYLDLKH